MESVTALAETALLFLLTGAVIWEAIQRLIGGRPHVVTATVPAFAIIAASIIVDFFRARTLHRVAGESASEALQTDALYFSSGMWSSIAFLIGARHRGARFCLGRCHSRRLTAWPSHDRYP